MLLGWRLGQGFPPGWLSSGRSPSTGVPAATHSVSRHCQMFQGAGLHVFCRLPGSDHSLPGNTLAAAGSDPTRPSVWCDHPPCIPGELWAGGGFGVGADASPPLVPAHLLLPLLCCWAPSGPGRPGIATLASPSYLSSSTQACWAGQEERICKSG